MASYRRVVSASLVASGLLSFSCVMMAQQPQASPLSVSQGQPVPEPTTSEWSRELLKEITTIWTEGNDAVRKQKLVQWVDQTASQVSYARRKLVQRDERERGQVTAAIKDVFSTLRRVNWQSGDIIHAQKVIAAWTEIVPVFIDRLADRDLSATQRRHLEQALVDLVVLSTDPQHGLAAAREFWQRQLVALGQLTRHPKISARLAALSILEAMGSDARPALQSVQDALSDSDCFVRLSALRTLQSIGVDPGTKILIARLQKDEDTLVRSTAIAIVQTSPMIPSTTAQSRQPALDLTVPITTPSGSTMVKSAPEPIKTVPSERMPVNATTTPISVKPDAPLTLPSTLAPVPLQPPASKPESRNEPTPLFGPPASSMPVKTIPEVRTIQPTAGVTPRKPEIHQPDAAYLWIPRLRQGTVEQQVQAVQELGKLGARGATAIPMLAEWLIKGEVRVRREIPLALAKMGASAKVATSMLERALNDSDTEVKVNAARALLELSDQ